MKILSIECSATPCSVAVLEDEKIVASSFVNVKLTHSQTLMPMIESLLESAMIDLSDIEGIAVSHGPGSFTGIRIGISAVKGLAAPRNLSCAPVSTLRAMAENFKDRDAIVCAVMDARCNQVYNALFNIENGHITRLCEDRALMCDELSFELEELTKSNNKEIIIVGDGAEIFYPFVENNDFVKLASEHLRYQNAVGVGLASKEIFAGDKALSPKELLPLYLRLPQAERELKLKKEQKK